MGPLALAEAISNLFASASGGGSYFFGLGFVQHGYARTTNNELVTAQISLSARCALAQIVRFRA